MELFVDLFRQKLFSTLGIQMLAVLLIFVRILSFMHFAPVFSHKSVPAHVRIVMSIFLTSMLAFKAGSQVIPQGGYSLIFAILVNVALGFVLGFVANLFFNTITASGEMMDSAMGFSSAQTFDPTHGSQTTIMGKFLGTLAIVIFFTIGGPEVLIKNLADSFDTFSIYAPSLSLNLSKIISLSGDIIAKGFVLSSPVVLTVLINDLVLGLVSRAAPQINAFQISFTIKPCIGILMLMFILPLFFESLSKFLEGTKSLF